MLPFEEPAFQNLSSHIEPIQTDRNLAGVGIYCRRNSSNRKPNGENSKATSFHCNFFTVWARRTCRPVRQSEDSKIFVVPVCQGLALCVDFTKQWSLSTLTSDGEFVIFLTGISTCFINASQVVRMIPN
mmetsp:Transcript_1583/g.2944  ORF Transcript_1583/g.2944 Transcript_1583/m.2944 type:complete len:129 (-) Transcript_1583:30-416(-)